MKKIIPFLLIIIFLTGCAKKTEQEYIKIAEQNLKNNNIPEAIKAYEDLLADHPESITVPKVLFELGKIYQSKADKKITEKESLDKAIAYFTQLEKKYPQSYEAPYGYFMIGFIQSNEFRDYQEATKTYKSFLEKYPNHAMSQAARDEIDNMGLTPEQVLEKKIGGNE